MVCVLSLGKSVLSFDNSFLRINASERLGSRSDAGNLAGGAQVGAASWTTTAGIAKSTLGWKRSVRRHGWVGISVFVGESAQEVTIVAVSDRVFFDS